MADLSFLQQIPGTVDKINRAYEEARKPRGYLGLSHAGHECKRCLWYMHNGYEGKSIEGRVLRLFQLGNVVEDQVVADLKQAGCTVTYQQREVVFTQENTRLIGHIDGIVKGLVEAPETAHLFECKSASKKKFDELLKLGSYELWNETYRWQIQFYLLGLGLKRAAVFVYCKDDSRLYMERIRVDKDATLAKLQSVFDAITSPIEPERLCPKADYYKAKWCSYHDECFCVKTNRTTVNDAWL